MLLYIFLFVTVFAAYFVKGITGFGNTLVMGSLFSFVVPNKVTTPVDLILSIPTNAYMAWKDRKAISLKIVIPLSLMLLAGIIPGTLLLTVASDWVLRSVLGLVVIGMAVEMLLRKAAPKEGARQNSILLLAIGVASGILAGLYSIGALLVAYISRTTEGRSQFRANMCCVFLVDNIFRFFLYWHTGLLTGEVLKLTLFVAPAAVLGMIAGVRTDRKLPEQMVKKVVIGVLIVSGSVLFLKNLLLH